MDLYAENEATHTWIDALAVSVHLLSINNYCDLFKKAGFKKVEYEQLKSDASIKQESGKISSSGRT